MDIVSHAGWGYATLRWRGKKSAWAGALAGAAPDLLFFIPSMAERVAKNGVGALNIFKNRRPETWRAGGPSLPPDLQHVYDHHYVYTHSFVILAAALGMIYLLGPRFRSWLWLGIPYALHIAMDIPTHERFQTPFLFPISRWTFQGWSWGHPWIFYPNWIALLGTLTYLWFRFGRREKLNHN